MKSKRLLDKLYNSSVEEIPSEVINNALDEARVTDRQRQVLVIRYGLDGSGLHTLDETAKILGVSRERVRQIEEGGISKLHHPRIRRLLREYIVYKECL